MSGLTREHTANHPHSHPLLTKLMSNLTLPADAAQAHLVVL